MGRKYTAVDGNEAAAFTAYRTNEVIAIYPITPSSPMGELSDEWSSKGIPNIWGTLPRVVEMQSEAGAAGAVHGSLQSGALTTTFTSSQGLLLMVPYMFKIAGELTSTVFHIAARTVATHALAIFGDHSDVMTVRSTGWAMLFSNNPQEVMDLALIAQASTLESRVPFLHIFDGFRTSHEVIKIEELTDDDMRAMIDDELVRAHRERALSPDRPIIRGTAQNPDAFFQSRERCNPFYVATPGIVQKAMDKFASIVGRQYQLFEYVGAPDAEYVVVMMGSGTGTAEETVQALMEKGERVGLLKVRLFRPFSREHFLSALPTTVKAIAVLDRTKEPGALGEPLYEDVVSALSEAMMEDALPFQKLPRVIGGRYGLASKEFTPAMVKAVFGELTKSKPKNHFTVGIKDDVTHTSLEVDSSFSTEAPDVVRAVFWGLGADGTVGANKNSVKIIAEETPNYAQGYFVYDSKKSGAVTVSHLRFGPRPILSTYLIQSANFVACHQFHFLERYNVLGMAEEGATFLLNSPYGPEEVWDKLPRSAQQQIIDKKLKFYVINAYDVAKRTGLGVRINTIMQTCFFAVSGVLPRDEAIAKIKEAIYKTYGRRGEAIIQQNYAAVDAAIDNLFEVKVPAAVTSTFDIPPVVPDHAPEFVKRVTAELMASRGDLLPVSAFPVDGTYPVDTAKWEKRNIALEVPVWEPDLCIQCGKCVYICPHATIRAKVYDKDLVQNAPSTFKFTEAKWRELPNKLFTIQVAVEDCTGCQLCVEVCPAKDKSDSSRKALNMHPQIPLRERERVNWEFFLSLPNVPKHDGLRFNNVKNVQLLRPLFEFSGACTGCGETPYYRLLTQLFGDRIFIANATGCSSIYCGNLPTTPFTTDDEGRGPTWSNSLFEDTAEFGFGMRLSINQQTAYAKKLLHDLRPLIADDELVDGLLNADQSDESGIAAQRQRVAKLKAKLADKEGNKVRDLLAVADMLVKKSVWIIGGDGWAYDIGYGGLDHVLASGEDVNILVMDTEVYSNTGGQASKATPLGAVARFAAGGKPSAKKELGMMAMHYRNVYIAQVAMGANELQTLRAFLEAEAYPGPSIIIAYSHCIAHGIDMSKGHIQQKLAVDSGYWPLYRYNPLLAEKGENPFQLDSNGPSIPLKEYTSKEGRYRILMQANPEAAERLMQQAQAIVEERWRYYRMLAGKATDSKT